MQRVWAATISRQSSQRLPGCEMDRQHRHSSGLSNIRRKRSMPPSRPQDNTDRARHRGACMTQSSL